MNVSLKHISTILSEEELVEKLPDNFKKVVAIELEEKPGGDGYSFKQVTLEAFDAEGQSKYLYRKGPPSGTGVTLTCKLGKPQKKDKKTKTPKEFAATAINKKVIAYLREMAEKASSEEGQRFGTATAGILQENKESLLEQVAGFAEQLASEKDESAIVTLVISGKEHRKYPGDVSPLRDYFFQRVNPETREIKGTSSVGEDALCACCGKSNKRVFCQPQTLPYFTFDKPGFIAGGFFKEKDWQEKAWRNFPMCAECLLAVRRGFKAVEEKLQSSLCGIRYLLIPNFAEWQSSNAQTVVQTIAHLTKSTDLSLQRDQEVLFAHRLSRETNTASFTFLFFKKNQSRMEILSTLENVLPTRMSEIAEAVDLTEQHDLLARFGEWTKATKIKSIPVNFGLLKDLFQPRRKTKGYSPMNLFLRAVQRVVYSQPVDDKEFFDAAMRYIRDELREQQSEGNPPWLTLATHKALASAFWLLNLNLLGFARSSNGALTQKGGAMTDYPSLNAEKLNERFDDFFQTFSGLFAQESHKVCYLMGVLCAQVLSEQRRRYENRQPFFRSLKDLKLDEAEMRGLLAKLKSKLIEYEKDHFNWELEKAISERFRHAGSPWKITNSEINFFFTLGLCEAQLFSAKAAAKQ